MTSNFAKSMMISDFDNNLVSFYFVCVIFTYKLISGQMRLRIFEKCTNNIEASRKSRKS